MDGVTLYTLRKKYGARIVVCLVLGITAVLGVVAFDQYNKCHASFVKDQAAYIYAETTICRNEAARNNLTPTQIAAICNQKHAHMIDSTPKLAAFRCVLHHFNPLGDDGFHKTMHDFFGGAFYFNLFLWIVTFVLAYFGFRSPTQLVSKPYNMWRMHRIRKLQDSAKSVLPLYDDDEDSGATTDLVIRREEEAEDEEERKKHARNRKFAHNNMSEDRGGYTHKDDYAVKKKEI